MRFRGHDGYSLLELLVALALTAVIAAMIVQTTRQLQPLRQIQVKYDAQAIADRLTEVIANDLRGAVALPLSSSDTRLPVIGRVDGMRFVAVVKTGFAAEGLREVSYMLETEPDGRKRLVRRIALRRFGIVGDDAPLVQEDKVFDRVVGVRFQYLGRDEQGAKVWGDRWEKPDELPLAVRLDLSALGAVSGKTVIILR